MNTCMMNDLIGVAKVNNFFLCPFTNIISLFTTAHTERCGGEQFDLGSLPRSDVNSVN